MSDMPPGHSPDPERSGKDPRRSSTAREPRVDRRRALIVALVAAVAWLVALFLPAYPVTDGDAIPGLMCAAFGALYGAWALTAWAGQLLTALVALVGVLLPHRSWVLRVLPLVVGLAAITAAATLIGMDVPLDESGNNRGEISGLGIGFYLWAASLLLVGLAPWFVRRHEEPPPS
ncbi:hypothetical protein [Nocardioides albertanoniae]|nr:hypothetical protein [Nocardioides albertanoniae]